MSQGPRTLRILAADIGGTNARFGAFAAAEDDSLALLGTCWLPTAESASFPDLAARLDREGGLPFAASRADVAAVAIAGPVEEGARSAPPNIAWDLDLARDAAALGFRRWVLLNDFAAQAHACRTAVMDRAEVVLSGRPDPAGVMAVVGAGTGLGKAALAPDGHGGWLALSTEAGHGLFPFAGEAEFAFWRFLREATGRAQVIGDMVCSGSGLSLLHRHLAGEERTPEEVAASFGPGSATLEWFARFLGRACREFALQTVSLGGLVVAGGIAARNPAVVRHPAFAAEFRDSETHAALLARIPVRLSADQDAGLWGAAQAGLLRVRAGTCFSA
ncbi:MAG: glucokinase [Thermodesulfobacteriota bacterium]